jgi:hypothetical protein
MGNRFVHSNSVFVGLHLNLVKVMVIIETGIVCTYDSNFQRLMPLYDTMEERLIYLISGLFNSATARHTVRRIPILKSKHTF